MTTTTPAISRPSTERPTGTSPVADLFAPASVAGLALPNSWVMAPMTRSHSPGGIPTAANADYYRRRAAGGVGLIVTEGTLIDHPSAGHETDVPRMSRAAAAGWSSVVRGVHAEGSAIVAQLWHVGSRRGSPDGYPAWTPSGVDEHGVPNSHPMTTADVALLVDAFADAGRIAYEVGFDGVEIHAAHGYLLDEFLWPATNHRTDQYGGTRVNRSRFVAEIIGAIRAGTSPDFPIGVRYSQFKERAFEARLADTPDELAEVLAPLVDAGANLFHASQRRFWEPAFAGSPLNLAGWTRKLTGLPAITVGSVGLTGDALSGDRTDPRSLAAVAARHAAGEFDLVAVGRPLLGNPDWVRSVQTGDLAAITDYTKEHEDRYW